MTIANDSAEAKLDELLAILRRIESITLKNPPVIIWLRESSKLREVLGVSVSTLLRYERKGLCIHWPRVGTRDNGYIVVSEFLAFLLTLEPSSRRPNEA
jgi:hypothetical protein